MKGKPRSRRAAKQNRTGKTATGTSQDAARKVSERLSGRAKRFLEDRVDFLTQAIARRSEVSKSTWARIESAPIKTVLRPDGTKLRVRLSDPYFDRLFDDNERAIGSLRVELAEARFLLSPPRGRPPDRIYELALEEKERNPELTDRQLAEKYLPNYFPDRTDYACEMIRSGLNRARQRRSRK